MWGVGRRRPRAMGVAGPGLGTRNNHTPTTKHPPAPNCSLAASRSLWSGSLRQHSHQSPRHLSVFATKDGGRVVGTLGLLASQEKKRQPSLDISPSRDEQQEQRFWGTVDTVAAHLQGPPLRRNAPAGDRAADVHRWPRDEATQMPHSPPSMAWQ